MPATLRYHTGPMAGSPTGAQIGRPLTDREIDELDAALAALPEHRESFDVAMLEGYLVGLLIQPDVVMPTDWLPPVFAAPDGEPMIPGDEAHVQRVIDLVTRRYNTLAAHILAREPFDPIVYDIARDDGAPPARQQELAALGSWAAGFLTAMRMFPAVFERADEDAELSELLVDILRHLPLDPDDDSEDNRAMFEEREQLDRERPLEDLDHAIEAVVDAVMDIADITRPRAPVVRAQPKVGRNDPCPCGSGRKFKQCHGRDAS
jgi:uncharacterized protein